MTQDDDRSRGRWVPTSMMRFVVALVTISTLVAAFVYIRSGAFSTTVLAFVVTAIVMQVAYFATVVLYAHLLKRGDEPAKPAKVGAETLTNGAPKQF